MPWTTTSLPATLRIPRLCVRIILGLSLIVMSFSLLEGQQISGVSNPEAAPNFQTFQHLGLEGALIAAVIVLWRTLQAERSASLALLKTSTEALLATASSNTELRRITEESKRSDVEMSICIKDLVRVIATMNASVEKLQQYYISQNGNTRE